MQKEPVTTENSKGRGRKILGALITVIAVPIVLLVSWKLGDRQFYLVSVIVIREIVGSIVVPTVRESRL